MTAPNCPLEIQRCGGDAWVVAQQPGFHPANRRDFLAGGVTLTANWVLALRQSAEAAEKAETAVRVYQESAEIFPNPERGFYAQKQSNRMNRLESLRAQGIALLLVTFDLREFRARDLTSEKLAELQAAHRPCT